VWLEIGLALGLVLIIEGILPFLSPARYRAFARLLSCLRDRDLRVAGLSSMLLGLLVIFLLSSGG